MNQLSLVSGYFQACAGGSEPLSECLVIGQFGVILGLLVSAVTLFIAVRREACPHPARSSIHSTYEKQMVDAQRDESKRPCFAVGDQVRTAFGVGVVKRILPGNEHARTAYSVSFVSWPSGIIFNEDQIAIAHGGNVPRIVRGRRRSRA